MSTHTRFEIPLLSTKETISESGPLDNHAQILLCTYDTE